MERNELYPKVFMWLTLGLLITFVTGYTVSLNTTMLQNILKGGSYMLIVVIELVIALYFSFKLNSMNKLTASICYILYSFVTGITFAAVFALFELSSIMSIFLVTSVVFFIFGFLGYTTKKDLGGIGNFLFMSLIGIIVTSIINLFLGSTILEILITIVGVIIFIGYIMYDMKKIEYLASYNEEAGPIYGAFQLYLDFINLFIDLLRLVGKAKD